MDNICTTVPYHRTTVPYHRTTVPYSQPYWVLATHIHAYFEKHNIYIYLLRLGTILIFLGSIQRWAQLLCLSWLLRTSTMTWRQGLSLVILVISIACDVSILMWLLDTSSHGSFQHLLHASPLLFDDVYYLASANATNTHQWDKYQLNHEITQLLLIDFSANT